MSRIHPSAVVDPAAEIGADTEIGPFCVIGPDVRIGAGSRLIAHVSIEGPSVVGEDAVIHPFAVIGGAPQDVRYHDECTELRIGPRAVIREHATVHRGTPGGRGVTVIGADCHLMVGAHVAHDARIGDHVTFVNNATIGGHVTIGDHVILGGLSAVHQHCRIGRHAFVAGMGVAVQDVIPFAMVARGGVLSGLNLVGLKRRGFSRNDIAELRGAYRMLFAREGTFKERLEDAARLYRDKPLVEEILAFAQAASARGVLGPAGD
ncbi:MAG: acyl-ACP--UDP-N-acetylglucosamine O-acyltransferase [Maricaulaceae bacterium]